MKIESEKYSAGAFLEYWSLEEAGYGRKRTFRNKITFSQPFENPPKIFIAITGFDIASLDVKAENVTIEGFTVCFNANAASRVREVTVDWLAIEV